MRLARPVRPTRRTGRSTPIRIAVLAVVAAAFAAPALSAVINPPFPGLTTVVTGVNASFVGAEEMPQTPTRVEVWRSGVRIATTGPITPDAGAIEVNHELGPLENCWVGTTPDFQPGDSVRLIQLGGNEYRSTVRDITMAAPVVDSSNPLDVKVIVKFRGADADATTPLPVAELGVELRQLGGGSRWIVAGDGTFQGPGVIGAVIENDPASLDTADFQAEFSFGANAAGNAEVAAGAPIKEASWTGAGEITFAEFGAASGPQAPCNAPVGVGPLGVGIVAASDTGASDADGVTFDTTPTITGLVSPNAEVNLYLDITPPAVPTQTLVANASGVFTYTPPALADGVHVLRTSEGEAGVSEVFANVDYSFTIDTTAPAAPTGLFTNPASPANNTTPSVLGSAPGANTVTVYTDEDCLLAQAGVGSTASFAAPGIPVTVATNAITQIAATATDLAGNTSACSNNIAYNSDATPPAIPTGLTTTPATSAATPSSDNTPIVRGTLASPVAGDEVRVYVNTACTGPPAGTGTPTAFNGGAGITVTVPLNQTSTIRASAVDAVGNVSGCSTAISYFHDNTPPGQPTGLFTTPVSPSNNNDPFVRGTAAAGTATVRVYETDDCTGPAVSGSPGTFANPGLQVSNLAEGSTTLSADAVDAAGNVSTCATVDYFVDTQAPVAPSITGTNPASPSSVNTPRVIGNAPVDAATIRIYVNDGTCAGLPAATGSASDFTSIGVQVTVTENFDNAIRARAVDAAGNASPCSGSVTYREDSTPPAGNPVITSGPSGAQKSRDAAFVFQSVVLDPGDVLECSLSTGADAFGLCDSSTTFARVGLTDGAYTFKVRVRDAQGNANTQTRQFQVDNIAPSVTITSGPTDPTGDTTPTFAFVANEGNVTYECGQSTTGTPTFAPCATPATIGPLPLGTWIFSVRATDAAGNVGVPATSGFSLQELIGAPFVSTKKVVLKNGRIRVGLRCTGPEGAKCSGSVDITRRIPATATTKARTVRIGHVTVALRAGQTINVTLPITAAGRNALRAAKSRKLAVKVVVTPKGGKASVFPLTISLPPAK